LVCGRESYQSIQGGNLKLFSILSTLENAILETEAQFYNLDSTSQFKVSKALFSFNDLNNCSDYTFILLTTLPSFLFTFIKFYPLVADSLFFSFFLYYDRFCFQIFDLVLNFSIKYFIALKIRLADCRIIAVRRIIEFSYPYAFWSV